ncbi:MAG: hypothetical protein Q9197_003116 [Variospora fuerteventurae]
MTGGMRRENRPTTTLTLGPAGENSSHPDALENTYPIPNASYSIDFEEPGLWLSSVEVPVGLEWARRRCEEHIRKHHDGDSDLVSRDWRFQSVAFGITPVPGGGDMNLKRRDTIAIIDAFRLKTYEEGYLCKYLAASGPSGDLTAETAETAETRLRLPLKAMEVELYVYDLSQGLARQMSQNFLGVQIDAVYHTALVFGGIEYFFGAGIQQTYPGATHHGRPMEVIPLGKTDLPMEIILEYLDSLRQVYTVDSYDLFTHNCNNFTNDFAMFLLGKGIPDHITSLPQTVLNTPFGQMLKPQLDSAMRGITQAPVAPAAIPQSSGSSRAGQANLNRVRDPHSSSISSFSHVNGDSELHTGQVHYATTLKKLDILLASARNSCAAIFFTSATCPPCKLVYPAYDELAAEAGDKAVLIKVDLSEAYEIGSRYQVRATPTFMSFLRGEKENEWVGASEGQLRGNVRMLIQMAHPPHPHTNLRLRTLQRRHRTVTYAKIPPLDKLMSKMGSRGTDPAVTALKDFIRTREASGASDAALPSLPTVTSLLNQSIENDPPDSLFPLVDLLRCALVDPRVSGFLAAEHAHLTVLAVLSKPQGLGENCPYSLRIVTLQLACNLFTSSILATQLLQDSTLCTPLLQLITSSLLDTAHPPVRVAAASLAFNMAAVNHVRRLDGKEDVLSEPSQVELLASVLETIANENESKDSVRGLLTAIGLLMYEAPRDGELVELCQALGAKEIVVAKKTFSADLRDLVTEVEQVLA